MVTGFFAFTFYAKHRYNHHLALNPCNNLTSQFYRKDEFTLLFFITVLDLHQQLGVYSKIPQLLA
jgi:hypothetical protein